MDLTSGVVLDIGEDTVTCVAVWRGEECDYQSCDPKEVSPDRLAEMVETVVIESSEDDEMQTSLRRNVVMTGVR